MTISAPCIAFIGENEEMVGGPELALEKINPVAVAVSARDITFTDPVEPEPTMADIVVSEMILIEVAGVPPKLTALIWLDIKPVPFIRTAAPVVALFGEKLVIVGGIS